MHSIYRRNGDVKLVTIAGSLREASLNKQLLRLASRLLEAAGAQLDPIDLRALGIPIYDGDLEASSGLPEGAQELCRRIAAADGLVLASPENNFSIPAVMKNWIDWVSRAKPMPLRGKSALLLSASPSLVGGSRGLLALRVPLEVLGVHVHPDMFSLASAHQAFRPDGELVDEALAKLLRRVVDGYLRIASAVQAAQRAK
jgi:NAD(P)H-dependent FMN reductase